MQVVDFLSHFVNMGQSVPIRSGSRILDSLGIGTVESGHVAPPPSADGGGLARYKLPFEDDTLRLGRIGRSTVSRFFVY